MTEDLSAGTRQRRLLSDVERHVASMAARGHTTLEIGVELGMQPNTVTEHLVAVYRKLSAARPAALAARCRPRPEGTACH